jgi:lipoyl-dependent peroxiredoxin
MAERTSEATWQGKLRDGHGFMKASSGAFQGAYSFGTRFGEARGTNPEELLAAAHASCYSMALAATTEKLGFVAASIHTVARVRVESIDGGFRISRSISGPRVTWLE